MADPLSITLAAITLGTALKDLTEMALKLHGSFKKHAHNMRAAESLAADTLEIVQDIENFYISRGDVLDNFPDVRDAVARLSKDMQSVNDECLPILQLRNSPERGLRRTLFKIEQWRNRKAVESNIRNLREQANKCHSRFTRYTQLGTVVAIGELKSTVSAVTATTRQSSCLQVSDENMLAFMGSTRAVLSTLPPGVMLCEDLVFKLYIRGHVHKIDDILKSLASKRSYAVEVPDDRHTQPFTTYLFSPLRTSGAVEYVRGNTVTEMIKLQQGLLNVKGGGNPIQEGAWTLNELTVDLAELGMISESLMLHTWNVDLYKTLSISHRDVYAPHLALAFFNLAVLSFDTGNFVHAIAMRTECLSTLMICAPTPELEALKADMLSRSAYFRHAIGEQSSLSLQDAENSVAMWERLGVDQMAVIGPPQGINYATFGSTLTGGDLAVHDYAYALDAQRVFLYNSERFQEALDVGERALRLYRALGQYYEEVQIQRKVATLCLFRCADEFWNFWSGDNIIPVSEALIYAEEAVRIWEKVQEITGADEEPILDSLTIQIQILVKMGRPSDALTVFEKLARRVRSMAITHRKYVNKMQDLAEMLFTRSHSAEAAMASRTVVEICRQSAESLPTSQRSLIDTLLDHTMHCNYADYCSEALIYSQEALSIAGQQRMKEATFTGQYLRCLVYAASMSLEAGYPQQAINQIQDALNTMLGPPIQRHLIGHDSTMLELISLEALAFLRFGRLSLAAATIAQGYGFAESTALNLQEDLDYGKLLSVSALVHRRGGKQDDALTAIKAAIPIFEFDDWIVQLCTLTDMQADMGHDAEALRTAKEAVQSRERGVSLSPLVEHNYKISQYSLCLRLFFNGEFTRARQLILEVRNFFEWHAHSRNAWFLNLARALRAEGILECASDRHAEGAAARTRLNELQQRLRATLPGVSDQVEVDLNYERNYPAWKRLLEKYPLTCSHWIEDEVITGQEYTIAHSHPTTSA
ncbi:hypothetical protein CPC08DRAFT_243943 [Agrocybe pediades]|nr:hypothetical protein CPC08DRAFT_243943 [Agrocybe pediades]